MTDHQAVLTLLEQALATSKRMQELAEAGDWDALVECEIQRRGLISALRALEQQSPLVPAEDPLREEILGRMQAILETDRITGELVRVWMSQLSTNLGEIDMARKVGAAYGVR